MIVGHLYVYRFTMVPIEYYPPLVIDPDTVEVGGVPAQFLKSTALIGGKVTS